MCSRFPLSYNIYHAQHYQWGIAHQKHRCQNRDNTVEVGDGKKIGGGRYDPYGSNGPSLLGGVQGGQGKIFGFNYPPGSVPDFIVEAWAGPHDYLNGWTYDAVGDLRKLSTMERFVGTFTNALNVVIATPIVVPSAIPPIAYPGSGIIYGESHRNDR